MTARFATLEHKLDRMNSKLTGVLWMLALLIGGVASIIIKIYA